MWIFIVTSVLELCKGRAPAETFCSKHSRKELAAKLGHRKLGARRCHAQAHALR